MKYVKLTRRDSKTLTKNMFTLSHIFLDRNQVLLLRLGVWCFRNELAPKLANDVAGYLEGLRTTITEAAVVLSDQSLVTALNDSIKLFIKYGKKENT